MLDNRSGRPVNLTTEIVGHRWSVVLLCAMMFGAATSASCSKPDGRHRLKHSAGSVEASGRCRTA
jgi:hypothetical protein